MTTVEISWPTSLATTKPPRLNYAGFCIYCLQRGCDSAKCRDRWLASTWDVCSTRGGTEDTGDVDPCHCMGGMIEVLPDDEAVSALDVLSSGIHRGEP